nr:MAG TPA: hypothetical protein [Caudoviricetes sp.]
MHVAANLVLVAKAAFRIVPVASLFVMMDRFLVLRKFADSFN